MFARINIKRGNRDQEEKPFWISFADLMTSLMVLFLVSLSVALLKAQQDTARAKKAEEAATVAQKELRSEQEKLRDALAKLERQERERDTRREERAGDIAACHQQLETIIARFNDGGDQGVRLDRARNVIDFGSRAEFEPGRHELRLEQAKALRDFSNRLVEVLDEELGVCRRWLRRVVVEGFTDNTGTYLYNLNLSLNRSQRVMCVLLSGEYATLRTVPKSPEPALFTGAPQRPVEVAQRVEPLPPEQQLLVKQLFLVGGYSSNSLKATPNESRRIELRIEFYQVDDERVSLAPARGDTGRCSIGTR
jgi:outer membrane protein OmpA-like peptidoglycan-associated protein